MGALPNLQLPQFPNVPIAPGVPPVLRGPSGDLTDNTTLLTDDTGLLPANIDTPQWGIFDDNGDPVVDADSVMGFEYQKEEAVAKFPIEEGGFGSFNKVERPYESRITYTKGGTESDRATFLSQLEDALKSLDLYTVTTPERSYKSANVTHFDYKRVAANGVTLLTVEVWLEEIRVSATTTFSKTKDPAGTDAVNDGAVQPATPTATQSAATTTGAK